MGILKDIKELVGINTEEEYDDEEVIEETSRTLSKREQMEMDTVDDFRYDDYSTIFIDPKQFEDCKKIANYIENEKMITINLEFACATINSSSSSAVNQTISLVTRPVSRFTLR